VAPGEKKKEKKKVATTTVETYKFQLNARSMLLLKATKNQLE